jgi:hypothetical protein
MTEWYGAAYTVPVLYWENCGLNETTPVYVE